LNQYGPLQFGRLHESVFDGAHEDPSHVLTLEFDADRSRPAGHALRWRDDGQFRFDRIS
jgi:hypothetical protein